MCGGNFGCGRVVVAGTGFGVDETGAAGFVAVGSLIKLVRKWQRGMADERGKVDDFNPIRRAHVIPARE